ncbi:hypothetical protein V1279_001021 [Bradyrhizobium sp. AZCC 1610]|uniref:DUF6602 domain-containing protein n=1 Tax=Bradyrhizobium sp. AZCC 1610 TaxID=3117020 RepID=UPI002FF27131
MITKFADLLQQFQDKKLGEIQGQDITHKLTIGEMFEGVTAQITNRALPPVPDLRVERGFVRGPNGELSREVDCMVVTGSGAPVPNTSKYVYRIDQVICVLEVKKTLNASEVRDARDKLAIVAKMAREFHLEKKTPVKFDRAALSFSLITGKHVGSLSDFRRLSPSLQAIFNLIATETLLPLRIIYSFGGYKTESGLRTAVVEACEQEGRASIDLEGFPDQVICGSFSVLKAAGNPYCLSTDDNQWSVVVSCSESPIRIMLELIWEKLSTLANAGVFFNDDLRPEKLKPLLMTEWDTSDRKPILRHMDYSEKQLAQYNKEKAPWEPSSLNDTEATVLMHLNQLGPTDLNDSQFLSFCASEGTSGNSIAKSLLQKRLVSERDGKIFPIHDPIIIHYMPTGEAYASFDQRLLASWLEERLRSSQN